MKMRRHTADILDFMKPWRAKLLRQGAELRKHIDPQHDALIAEAKRREQEAEDAPPGP